MFPVEGRREGLDEIHTLYCGFTLSVNGSNKFVAHGWWHLVS